MEVDSVVALELHLNELEVASNIGIIFSDIKFFGGAKGFVSIQTLAFLGVKAFSSDTTFFDTVDKDK
jgi:hypothetical protein